MFLDVALGIILAVGTSYFFNLPLTGSLILLSTFLILLPDIDFIIELLRHRSVGGRVIREHRRITHFPLVYLFLTILIFFIFGAVWTTLFGLTTLLHFIHDSIGLGWGIQWLWPVSKKSYKFFAEKHGGASKNLITSWDEDELKAIVPQYGDPNWIRNNYLRFSKTLIIEISALLVSIFVLILYLFY